MPYPSIYSCAEPTYPGPNRDILGNPSYPKTRTQVPKFDGRANIHFTPVVMRSDRHSSVAV